jgi:hypothetical protein
MKYRIEIECDNSAFFNPNGAHDPCAEVASILENLCLHLRAGDDFTHNLYDTNGNTVGFAKFVGRTPK